MNKEKEKYIMRVSTKTEVKEIIFDTYEEALANSLDYLKMNGCSVEFASESDRYLFGDINDKKVVDKLSIEIQEEMNELYKLEEQEEIERQQGEHTCYNCRRCYEEYGMTNCKKHDLPMEDMSGCDDWE